MNEFGTDEWINGPVVFNKSIFEITVLGMSLIISIMAIAFGLNYLFSVISGFVFYFIVVEYCNILERKEKVKKE